MASVFNPIDNQAMVDRIEKLTPQTQALWGKMSVNQMFVHSTKAIEVAYGKIELKVLFIFRLLGRLLKNKVIVKGNLDKNSPTAKEFVITDQPDFEVSKKDLIQAFRKFAQEGPSCIKLHKHPFWGPLTIEEWDMLMWKHLDHHLRQFGV
ncbi:DUF1569 domain-containing protein [Flavobacterium sp. CYK-4]|uniref:DUF1569 domain-containing protein n=1 Tax=Flavobacterium lotistagni TaxID=2709660 RepID=UPI00140C23E9|nr:DUF1569 domain-containing protein [Flavobacterium lotistagni]NHM06184.1 DUF1569 domain-containing protein [Flavobacterium lotistagni]